MFDLKITAETAIKFYLTAKGMDGISATFLMCVWDCTHQNNNLTMEFTKLRKQDFSAMLGIKEAMLKRYIKRLVDTGFLSPMDGFRGVYKYIANPDIDYIMKHRYDLEGFVFSVSTESDFKIAQKDNIKSSVEDSYNDENLGILEYSKEINRYQLICSKYDDKGNEEKVSLHDFHCGDSLQIKYNGHWYTTRFECDMDKRYYLVKPDNLKRWPKKPDNLFAKLEL